MPFPKLLSTNFELDFLMLVKVIRINKFFELNNLVILIYFNTLWTLTN